MLQGWKKAPSKYAKAASRVLIYEACHINSNHRFITLT